MEARRMKVAKWTDWFNLLERRGKWEHWMVGFMSRGGDQVFTLPFN